MSVQGAMARSDRAFGLCYPALLLAMLTIIPTFLWLTMDCMLEIFQATIESLQSTSNGTGQSEAGRSDHDNQEWIAHHSRGH